MTDGPGPDGLCNVHCRTMTNIMTVTMTPSRCRDSELSESSPAVQLLGRSHHWHRSLKGNSSLWHTCDSEFKLSDCDPASDSRTGPRRAIIAQRTVSGLRSTLGGVSDWVAAARPHIQAWPICMIGRPSFHLFRFLSAREGLEAAATRDFVK